LSTYGNRGIHYDVLVPITSSIDDPLLRDEISKKNTTDSKVGTFIN